MKCTINMYVNYIYYSFKILQQSPPQALRFSHRRGERETRVTGDEPRGTMGRVQMAGERTFRALSPSCFPLRAHVHRESDVWVRGRYCNVFRIPQSGLSPIHPDTVILPRCCLHCIGYRWSSEFALKSLWSLSKLFTIWGRRI